VKRVPGHAPTDWPASASRAVREYFGVLDREGADQGARARRRQPPKAVSLTDPLAAWVVKRNMRPIFAYDANYLIDHKLGVIVDAEGTRANRVKENRVAVAMVRRGRVRPDAQTPGRRLRIGEDTQEPCGIEPHIPVWDKSGETKGKFTKADFTYDKERDLYICPGGKNLTCTGKIDQGRILPYRASSKDCRSCALKPRCTSAPARKVSRDIDEDVRDHVRALAKTEAFKQSRRERKKVEMAFAHMKHILKLDRLRLRGLSGARDEVLLTGTAQNLRKLARYVSRPPPLCLYPSRR
jgi:hypothetical protein